MTSGRCIFLASSLMLYIFTSLLASTWFIRQERGREEGKGEEEGGENR